METIKAKRTTQYGIQLEDESYRNTTDPVKKFLTGKLPAELEIQEMDGKKISKVRIMSQSDAPEIRPAKESSLNMMKLAYTKDIFLALLNKAQGEYDVTEMAKLSASLIKVIEQELE